MTEPRVVPFLVSELRLPPQERELLGREWWPSYAHAVIHRDGAFLFDNGVGVSNAEVEARFSPRVTPIEDALAALGISMTDVTGVANCHLHFDHSGQNARLPKGVPIFVQRREWAMVYEPDYTVPEWIDVPGLTYEVLDGETEVAPGLRLIPTPGHTAGHQSLVVETSAGSIVLAGSSRGPSGTAPPSRPPRAGLARPTPTPTSARSSACARWSPFGCTSRTIRRSGLPAHRR